MNQRTFVLPMALALAAGAGCSTGSDQNLMSSGGPGGTSGSGTGGSLADGALPGSSMAGSMNGGPAEGGLGAGMVATGPIIGTPVATFDAVDGGVSGFRLDTFVEPANLAVGGGTPPTLSWIGTEGSPDLGCLQITAPFSAANQYVDLESPIFTPLQDWAGKTLHVRIKLAPGSMFAGSPVMYVKTGSAYYFYPMTFVLYPPSSDWQEFVLPLVSPAPAQATAGADSAQVITYGIHPTPGSSPPVTPTPVTFFVDSFSIE